MRILWLTENYPPQRGGMAQSCDRIINGLRAAGISIEIIHFTNKSSGFNRKQQLQGGYTASAFEESDSHTLNLTWNYVATLGEFDMVACFGGYLSMIAAPIYAQWLGVRLITFLRGNDFDTAIFTPRKRELLQYALEQSWHIFAVTSDKKHKAEKWIPEASISYIPNGISLDSWSPTKSEYDFAKAWRKNHLMEHRLCFGMIGQLKAKKGAHFLVSALRKTALNEKIHLLLVGDLEESLEAMLQESEFSYTLLPFQDRYQLLKYYLSCDALIIPSYYDGMPNVLLEGGSLGVPIIASNVDGMKDLITHEEEGLLFQVGNEDDCRKICYQFISLTEEERKTLGSNLKAKIHEKYTTENEIASYLEILR